MMTRVKFINISSPHTVTYCFVMRASEIYSLNQFAILGTAGESRGLPYKSSPRGRNSEMGEICDGGGLNP